MLSISWREALRDRQQRLTAGKEAGQKALVGTGAVVTVAASGYALIAKKGSKLGA
jgi:hypothetical protein